MQRLIEARARYAKFVTASLGPEQVRIEQAFAAVPREKFVGVGPWTLLSGSKSLDSRSDDPALLYQDVLVALTDTHINNGQPSLHAICLGAAEIEPGETFVHVGAGTGYYTAIAAELVGPRGSVIAYEIDTSLARRAAANLADLPHVRVHGRSGTEPPLPACDVLYVSAGATAPLPVWLEALRPGGRLIFPLTPAKGFGAMLLVRQTAGTSFHARFLVHATFIPCIGARDQETGRRLSAVFRHGNVDSVKSLHRHTKPDDTCWFAGAGWWLSTAEPLPERANAPA